MNFSKGDFEIVTILNMSQSEPIVLNFYDVKNNCCYAKMHSLYLR